MKARAPRASPGHKRAHGERAGDFSNNVLPAPSTSSPLPFPGNQVPSFFQNPIGQAIAGLYPLPNRNSPLANFVSSPNLEDRDDQFDIRIDRPVGNRLDLSARYSYSDRTLLEPFSGAGFSLVPGYGNTLDRRAQNLVASGVSVITPRLLNEARFGYTRVANQVNQEGQGISINREVGLPELSTNPRDWGLSFITVTGYSPLGHEYNNPQNGITDAFQFVDTITWSPGAHLIKGGFDLRTVRQDAFRDVRPAVSWRLLRLPTPATGGGPAAWSADDHGRRALDNPQRLRRERRPVRAGPVARHQHADSPPMAGMS
jgi:hypothetical protein